MENNNSYLFSIFYVKDITWWQGDMDFIYILILKPIPLLSYSVKVLFIIIEFAECFTRNKITHTTIIDPESLVQRRKYNYISIHFINSLIH